MVQLILGRHVVPRLSILVDVGTGVLVCLGVVLVFLDCFLDGSRLPSSLKRWPDSALTRSAGLS
jgi:hypothetical protein